MLKSNKRAVSTIIAYVLLIGLAVSMSVLVHNWLKLYVAEDESQTCPEDVALSIEGYSYSSDWLNLTIKNRGKFNIEDLSVKVSTDSESGGIDPLKLNYAVTIGVGDKLVINYTLEDLIYEHPTYLEIQPVIFEDGEIIYCSQTIGQKIYSGAFGEAAEIPENNPESDTEGSTVQ